VTNSHDIAHAAELLREGKLVAFPTETVYGLGADARSPEAIERIYALKGRPSNHPVIVHVADPEDMRIWARDIPVTAWALADAFWPGPLTLILPRADRVPLAVTGGQDSVAVRIPSHPVARHLLKAFGSAIAAPSANRYGRVSPTRADHVRDEFGDDSPYILDGGGCEIGLESTIVSLMGPPTLLRPGGVSRAQIEAIIGPLSAFDSGEAPRAPGTTIAHYAPSTPLRLMDSVALRENCPPGAAVLAFSTRLDRHEGPWMMAERDVARYGHDLYAALRTLDQSRAPVIVIETPPEDPSWEAVRDRLSRSAAAYRGTDLP
jgi:L-threonylcarbamoyladenylate synthase